MVGSIGVHPVLVVAGALAQHFLAHHRQTQDLADEIHHLLRPGQPAQVAVDHDAVEAVVNKGQQIAE